MGENQIHLAEKVKLKPLLSICEISTVRFHSKNIQCIWFWDTALHMSESIFRSCNCCLGFKLSRNKNITANQTPISKVNIIKAYNNITCMSAHTVDTMLYTIPDLSCRSSNFAPLSRTLAMLPCIIPMTPLISDFTFNMPSFMVGFGFTWWNPSGAAKLNKTEHKILRYSVLEKLISGRTDLITEIYFMYYLIWHGYKM